MRKAPPPPMLATTAHPSVACGVAAHPTSCDRGNALDSKDFDNIAVPATLGQKRSLAPTSYNVERQGRPTFKGNVVCPSLLDTSSSIVLVSYRWASCVHAGGLAGATAQPVMGAGGASRSRGGRNDQFIRKAARLKAWERDEVARPRDHVLSLRN
ncbi:hypothetical protein PMIN06_011686 [Paraphaeosphaeria minitans]|uniref:Uncharacterized protein n=1 Tax=Paraphaeosphaeria minitans TaxID=565426 RepID=A0A9P6GM66_9PLEO|nr:hypothetical protein PMIN01_03252 [Paraphaeosphaeria minitans]